MRSPAKASACCFSSRSHWPRRLEKGDLSSYQAEHRRIGRRPEFMADLMLLLDQRSRLRDRVMRTLAGEPALFAGFLAMHTAIQPQSASPLGWGMPTVTDVHRG